MSSTRIITFNVNGVRSIVKKDFLSDLKKMNPDIMCLQETKAQDDQVAEALSAVEGYHVYSNSAEKKGYSGTCILSKKEPLSIKSDIGIKEHDTEGRVLLAEYDDFQVLNVYVPNGGSGLKRLDYRATWDKAFGKYLRLVNKKKPLIVTGDFNVAHNAIDLANPKSNYNKTAGYTQVEIDGFTMLLGDEFFDIWRHRNPDTIKYSFWSVRTNARARNAGWRIDYFLVSRELESRIKNVDILNDIMGSDHCPVMLEIE